MKPDGWSYHIRLSGLIEWTMDGQGHPDPDSAEYLFNYGVGSEMPPYKLNHYLIHGCSGACSRPDFPGNPNNITYYEADAYGRRLRLYNTGDLFDERIGRFVSRTPGGKYRFRIKGKTRAISEIKLKDYFNKEL